MSGKRIASKPAPKVDVASDDVDSNDEVEEVDNNRDEQRQKTEVSSNIKVDNVLELPMRKKIVSSREYTVKRKKRPGKARKPGRAPELHNHHHLTKMKLTPAMNMMENVLQAASFKNLLLQPR